MDTTIKKLAEKSSEKKGIEFQKAYICFQVKEKKNLLDKLFNELHNKSYQIKSLKLKIGILKSENDSFLSTLFDLKNYIENKIEECKESNVINENKLRDLEEKKNSCEKELLYIMEGISQKKITINQKNKDLENENFNTCKEIEELIKTFRNRKQAENNRITLFKQKANMMNNLIESETVIRAKNQLALDVSKILKSHYSKIITSTRNIILKKSKTLGKN